MTVQSFFCMPKKCRKSYISKDIKYHAWLKRLFPSIFLKDILAIGATIRIGQEIQCLPYAEFLLKTLPIGIFFFLFFLSLIEIGQILPHMYQKRPKLPIGRPPPLSTKSG